MAQDGDLGTGLGSAASAVVTVMGRWRMFALGLACHFRR